MTNSSAAAPVPPSNPAGESANVVIALRIVDDLIAAIEIYYEYLAENVWNHHVEDLDEAELDCRYDRLCTLDALLVLALVWGQTGLVAPEELATAGLEPLDKEVTRRLLGSALKLSSGRPESHGSSDMYARRAQRIVEAAMTYGLIELQADGAPGTRANFKPLRATAKLHSAMTKIGPRIASIFYPHVSGV
jgi:hypothetical protein